MKKLLLLLLSLNIYSQTIESYFEIPKNYKRIIQNDYHSWIISKNINTKDHVKYFNGQMKEGFNKVYVAKFVYDIGNKDLHQCADAVMYNKARYLFESKQYNKISFTFSHNAKIYSYTGNFQNFNEYTFKKYITKVWAWSGTWSLDTYDTVNVNIKDIKPGDLFIVGGFPGHAISVIDIVINKNGHKKYMLAQSYMPAQEQQILLNPIKKHSVWYDLHETKDIVTPQYVFTVRDLKRFKNN
jgi:hypothetical protein